MNPSHFSSKILFYFIIFFVVFTSKVTSFSTQPISYSDHCNSFAPEAIPTDEVFTRHPFLEPVTSHYTGGQNILDQDPESQWSILFAATQNLFQTNVFDTYKIQARLSFFTSNIHQRPSNFSGVGWENRRSLVFRLDGFWSVSTSKLCMVGSARWFSKQGNPLKLDAVLKLKFARFINLKNSLVSGILESVVSPHDSNYFSPISMVGFPRVAPFKYNYTLVTNEECNVINKKTRHEEVISMQSLDICGIFTQRFTAYKLEYPNNCKNCSLIGEDNGHLPSYVSLYAIQCSVEDKKLRLLVEFQDRRSTPYDQSFDPEISLIGEGTWNGTNNEMCIVACRILNQSDPLGSARVGDCSIRLTFWFPMIWSIKKTHTTEGRIWTTKITNGVEIESGRMVNFRSFDHSLENYGWKYEYTQMEKVNRVCPKKKRVVDKYQFGYYGFDMFVKHKNMVSTGSAFPVFVGDRLFNGLKNITFEISFGLNISSISRSEISSLILSTTNDRIGITAEGVYDDETGQICMIGCRNLNSKNGIASFDCEILVKFQLPQGNESYTKGSIKSLRRKTDVLYFKHLHIISVSYTESEARETIRRMELEIILVLITDTLACVFIGQQLFHLKRKPEMVNFISVFMMLILTFGHMVPLVLNFERVFSSTRDPQNIPHGENGGWFDVNEVIARIVTMVAFIMQFRLLQLTWSAKERHSIHEIWTSGICLLIGGLFMLLVKRENNNYIIDMRSFAGLTVDGFLIPQIVLNVVQISKGTALCCSFLVGTTFVRSLPHVYDLYRGPKRIGHQFDRLYIFANPRADFYIPDWDIVIVCGGIVFAVIVFLQQRFGGRFMFPKIFRETIEYEMVHVESEEQQLVA